MLLSFVGVVFFSRLFISFLPISFTQRRSICSCHFTFIGNCSVIECDMIAMIVLVSCTVFAFYLFFMPVFFMGISIAILFVFFTFNCSRCRFSSSGVKMLFIDIKRNWLKSNCESSCAAYVRMCVSVCVVSRVLAIPFNWNISTHTNKIRNPEHPNNRK